jgi:hypothetical protein
MSTVAEILAPDYRRLTRANDPAIRFVNPAWYAPVENANQTLNKVVVTMNRGGSNPRNPILKGLSGKFQITLALDDSLVGVWIYQDRASLGSSLKSQATPIGQGAYELPHVYGFGQSIAGSPTTGAKRNFLRVQSKFGSFDREFWVKTHDADIVAVKSTPCLDPSTLDPVEIIAEIVDSSQDWLQLPIDFFVSWNDEFQALHNARNEYLDNGALKSYGGAAFVSFFDTSTATEGVGVQVNPVTKAAINDRHLIEVENTVGLKEITVRFRARQDSAYFVDIPIKIRVVQETLACKPPVVEPCIENLLKIGTALPANTPAVPSEPGVPTVPGTPGTILDQDLLIIAVRGAVVGGDVRLVVRRWKLIYSATDLSGAEFSYYSDTEYIPMSIASDTPAEGAPYQSPKIYAIALSVASERANNIAAFSVFLKDGDLTSYPVAIVGPGLRQLQFFPNGEAGGGVGCCGPAGCVGGPEEPPGPTPYYYDYYTQPYYYYY